MSDKKVLIALVGSEAQIAAILLVRGMYGSEFRPGARTFGLMCGQMRVGGKITHNSGWYNAVGEKLGWGDLSVHDLTRIAAELPSGETFYILPEYASYWDVKRNNPQADPAAPGVAYCREHCTLVITRGRVYYINDYSQERGDFLRDGLTMTRIAREQIEEVCR